MKKTVKKKFTFLLIIFIVLSIIFTTIGQERNLRLFKELFDETDETGKKSINVINNHPQFVFNIF
jgi:hypothetical protein